MGNEVRITRRKYIRSNPDPLDVAYLDSSAERMGFVPEDVGLILEESARGGCSLVFRGSERLLKVGQKVRLKVGRLSPLLSQVVWVKSFDDQQIIKAGFSFLE